MQMDAKKRFTNPFTRPGVCEKRRPNKTKKKLLDVAKEATQRLHNNTDLILVHALRSNCPSLLHGLIPHRGDHGYSAPHSDLERLYKNSNLPRYQHFFWVASGVRGSIQ